MFPVWWWCLPCAVQYRRKKSWVGLDCSYFSAQFPVLAVVVPASSLLAETEIPLSKRICKDLRQDKH